LTLEYDAPLSNFAFNFNLRLYTSALVLDGDAGAGTSNGGGGGKEEDHARLLERISSEVNRLRFYQNKGQHLKFVQQLAPR
jgi:hypothetical protein